MNNTAILRKLERRFKELTNNEFEFKAVVTSDGIQMESDYWYQFQDQGVQGTKMSSIAPFKFTDRKMPPPSSFSKYTQDKSRQFAIAKTVQQDGIEAKDYSLKYMRDAEVRKLIEEYYFEEALDILPNTI